MFLATLMDMLNSSSAFMAFSWINPSQNKNYSWPLIRRWDNSRYFEEPQELFNRFSHASKALGFTFRIILREIINQPRHILKQIRGVKYQSQVHQYPNTPITIQREDLNLKYVNLLLYLGNKVNIVASLDNEISNGVAKSTNIFGKLYHRLWNKKELIDWP